MPTYTVQMQPQGSANKSRTELDTRTSVVSDIEISFNFGFFKGYNLNSNVEYLRVDFPRVMYTHWLTFQQHIKIRRTQSSYLTSGASLVWTSLDDRSGSYRLEMTDPQQIKVGISELKRFFDQSNIIFGNGNSNGAFTPNPNIYAELSNGLKFYNIQLDQRSPAPLNRINPDKQNSSNNVPDPFFEPDAPSLFFPRLWKGLKILLGILLALGILAGIGVTVWASFGIAGIPLAASLPIISTFTSMLTFSKAAFLGVALVAGLTSLVLAGIAGLWGYHAIRQARIENRGYEELPDETPATDDPESNNDLFSDVKPLGPNDGFSFVSFLTCGRRGKHNSKDNTAQLDKLDYRSTFGGYQ